MKAPACSALLLAATIGVAAGAGAQSSRAASPRPPAEFEVTAENFAAWRAAIRPASSEVLFRRIPWHLDIGAAVRLAVREQRPVLLWLMDGHPFGPT